MIATPENIRDNMRPDLMLYSTATGEIYRIEDMRWDDLLPNTALLDQAGEPLILVVPRPGKFEAPV